MMITLREEGPLHCYSMLSIFFITFFFGSIAPPPPRNRRPRSSCMSAANIQILVMFDTIPCDITLPVLLTYIEHHHYQAHTLH